MNRNVRRILRTTLVATGVLCAAGWTSSAQAAPPSSRLAEGAAKRAAHGGHRVSVGHPTAAPGRNARSDLVRELRAAPADDQDATDAAFLALERDLVSQWGSRSAASRPQRGDRFLIVGSSSVAGNLGRLMVRRLQEVGFEASRFGMSATGFSRPDYYDWMAALDKLPIDNHVAGVLVYMGVNDPQGIWLWPAERAAMHRKGRDKWVRFHEPEWPGIYMKRVTALIDKICDRGARRVIIMPPADVRWLALDRRLRRVRRLQILGARASKCGAAVSPAGDQLYLLDRAAERREPRRLKDGYHLSTHGAEVVWQRVRRHLLHSVGGLPLPSTVVANVSP